jgi:hypothetical protein
MEWTAGTGFGLSPFYFLAKQKARAENLFRYSCSYSETGNPVNW